MLATIFNSAPWIQFVTPPLIGAFIGYLTNKIAIKMLFRPLRPYRILGIRIPMTPGVIPARRRQLGENIGKMVGSHLLTGKDVRRALEKDSFQKHLFQLVDKRCKAFLNIEFPAIVDIIPQEYASFFAVGRQALSWNLKKYILQFLQSEEFLHNIGLLVDDYLESLLQRDIDSILSRKDREVYYKKLDQWAGEIVESKALEQWLEDFIFSRIHDILQNKKSIQEVVPDAIIEIFLEIIRNKMPDVVLRISKIAKEPDVQKKIAEMLKNIVDGFVQSLGPMASIVQGFIDIETIERVVGEYLSKNEGQFAKLAEDPELVEQFTQVVIERLEHYLSLPIIELLGGTGDVQVQEISQAASKKILNILQDKSVSDILGSVFRDVLENYLLTGQKELHEVMKDISGEDTKNRLVSGLQKTVSHLVRSEKISMFVSGISDALLERITSIPIGKVSKIIPQSVTIKLEEKALEFVKDTIAVETPGIVHSLDIDRIISEKVDSLDLLKLEELLLSIMKEQFKYINLFGALIGFMIGCINLVLFLL